MPELAAVPSYDEILAAGGQLLRDYGPEAVEAASARRHGPPIKQELQQFTKLVEAYHNPLTDLPIGVTSLFKNTPAKAQLEYKYLPTPNITIGIFSYFAGRMTGEALNVYDGPSPYLPTLSIVRANALPQGDPYKMELLTPALTDDELCSLRQRLNFASTVAPDAIRDAYAASERRIAQRTKNATRLGLRFGLDDPDL